ncbi:hypothetical protein F5146DRAFT_1008907 [Armillaria mellea]|nr:hypothetical protein F5146DRAFT_1008907 [Armillaria mellea]
MPLRDTYGIHCSSRTTHFTPVIEALSSDAYFLPRLKSLELVWRHEVNEGALLEMLERRHQMNLEEVSLGTRYPEPEITEEIRACLEKFQEIGLRVQVLNVER